MSIASLLRHIGDLGPIRFRGDGIAFNPAQCILVAKHTFVVAYAELYGAQRGVVTREHADAVASGIQIGVMRDSPSVLLADWYDDDLRQLAIDAMALLGGTP